MEPHPLFCIIHADTNCMQCVAAIDISTECRIDLLLTGEMEVNECIERFSAELESVVAFWVSHSHDNRHG